MYGKDQGRYGFSKSSASQNLSLETCCKFHAFRVFLYLNNRQMPTKNMQKINQHHQWTHIKTDHFYTTFGSKLSQYQCIWLVNSQIGDPDPEVDRQGIPVLHPPSHLTMRWSPEKVTLQLAQPWFSCLASRVYRQGLDLRQLHVNFS